MRVHKSSKVEAIAICLQDLMDVVLVKERPTDLKQLWYEHQLIRQTLDHATELQKELRDPADEDPLHHPRTDEDLEAFLDWARRQRIIHESVDVIRCENGFGLKANRPIKRGETLVSVPKSAMLTSQDARLSNMLKSISPEEFPFLDENKFLLALYLCCQKFTYNSKWAPYIKMLPTKLDAPIFYTEEQLQYLKPSPYFEEALCNYRCVAYQFCRLFLQVGGAYRYNRVKDKSKHRTPVLLKAPLTVENFTFDTYRWACACVVTRPYTIPEIGENCEKIAALVPMLDFAKHVIVKTNAEGFVDHYYQTAYTTVDAHRDYNSGEIAFVHSGRHLNFTYLLLNGCVPPENPYNRYMLKLSIPRSGQFYSEKKELFERMAEDPSDIFLIGSDDNPIPSNLFLLAEVIVSKHPDGRDIETLQNQLSAFKFLKDRFALLRRQYSEINDESNDFQKSIARILRSEADILEYAEKYCAKSELELQEELIPDENTPPALDIARSNAPAVGAATSDTDVPVPEASRSDSEAKASDPEAPAAEDSDSKASTPEFVADAFDAEPPAAEDGADTSSEAPIPERPKASASEAVGTEDCDTEAEDQFSGADAASVVPFREQCIESEQHSDAVDAEASSSDASDAETPVHDAVGLKTSDTEDVAATGISFSWGAALWGVLKGLFQTGPFGSGAKEIGRQLPKYSDDIYEKVGSKIQKKVEKKWEGKSWDDDTFEPPGFLEASIPETLRLHRQHFGTPFAPHGTERPALLRVPRRRPGGAYFNRRRLFVTQRVPLRSSRLIWALFFSSGFSGVSQFKAGYKEISTPELPSVFGADESDSGMGSRDVSTGASCGRDDGPSAPFRPPSSGGGVC